MWGTHLLPHLGDDELRAITPTLVEDLRARFEQERVGVPSQLKALIVLQGILRRAVVRAPIPANPVSAVDKPRQRPTYLQPPRWAMLGSNQRPPPCRDGNGQHMTSAAAKSQQMQR